MVFSERLKSLLDEKGTTWAEVSKQLSIGRNQQKYWETHDSAPDGKTLVKLAEHFGVTSDYLLGIDTMKEKALMVLDDPDLTLTADEKWFILKLRQLDKEGRTVVEGTLVSEVRRVENEKGKTASAG